MAYEESKIESKEEDIETHGKNSHESHQNEDESKGLLDSKEPHVEESKKEEPIANVVVYHHQYYHEKQQSSRQG